MKAETFAFRPAPGQPPSHFTLSGDSLATDAWQLDLAQVSQARWSNRHRRAIRQAALELESHAGRHQIAITLPDADWPQGKEARTFLMLAAAILERLATNPTEVEISRQRAPNRALFTIGLVAVLAGPAAFLLGIAMGAETESLLAAAIPLLFLLILGALLMATAAPWQRPLKAPPRDLADTLQDLAT